MNQITKQKLWPILSKEKQTPSEFEIQAEIYRKLLAWEFIVRGEVRTHTIYKGEPRNVKLDLVVWLRDKLICIIETKSWCNFLCKRGIDYIPNDEQAKKYATFGVPVFFCGHMQHVDALISAVVSLVCKIPNYVN